MKLDVGFDYRLLMDGSREEWSYGDEDYEGIRCM